MAFAEIGVVHGSTITLDAPVPPLEGRRVRVLLEVIDGEEIALSAAQQEDLWREWVAHGPQGPIEDDSSWPDDE